MHLLIENAFFTHVVSSFNAGLPFSLLFFFFFFWIIYPKYCCIRQFCSISPCFSSRRPAAICKLFNGRRPAAFFVVTSINQIWGSQFCPKLDTELLVNAGKDWNDFQSCFIRNCIFSKLQKQSQLLDKRPFQIATLPIKKYISSLTMLYVFNEKPSIIFKKDHFPHWALWNNSNNKASPGHCDAMNPWDKTTSSDDVHRLCLSKPQMAFLTSWRLCVVS
jgi:hypothetical protein